MATNYARGADFERQAMRVLEDNGYVVVRSAGSKGPIDLCAVKPGQVLLVQAKRDGYIGPGERSGLLQIQAAAGPTSVALLAYKAGPRSGVQFAHVTCAGRGDDWFPDEVISDV